MGAYVWWYGWYELRVYSGGSSEDPIIDAAGEIQNRLAHWVDAIAPGAFAIALAVLVVAVIALRLQVRTRALRADRSRTRSR